MNDDSRNTIVTYIKNHPLAILSTVDDNGQPRGSTIYIGSDDHLNVYFMTKHHTDKAHNLRRNPQIALTLSGEDHQTTLQISGEAHEVTVPDEGAAAFQILGSIKHETADFRLPITKLDAGPYVVYRVDVSHATLSEYEPSSLNGLVRTEFRG